MKGKVVAVVGIEQRIFIIRGQKVMLSPHLAELYGVEVRVLIQAVKRNIKRFPEDFMFQLTWEEIRIVGERGIGNLGKSQIPRSQNVILESGANIKYLPYAFTEQGIAMLSSVLNSERAVQVNIAIMRAFVKLREVLSTHKELAAQFKELERKVGVHNEQIAAIFEAIRQLMAVEEKPKKGIGYLS
ncbi:MAG: ORF6N domain-containing protein [Candidatus Omnitrophota bacterium]|nr:ORF6N domain-containing protein [Candidatus Omnitrophota bacterium]